MTELLQLFVLEFNSVLIEMSNVFFCNQVFNRVMSQLAKHLVTFHRYNLRVESKIVLLVDFMGNNFEVLQK